MAILSFEYSTDATYWGIMFSEVSQKQKDKYHRISFLCSLKKNDLLGTESSKVFTKEKEDKGKRNNGDQKFILTKLKV